MTRAAVAVAAWIALAAPTAAADEPLDDRARAALRRRLLDVTRDRPGFARARLVLGALELGDGRPEHAARAIEEAIDAGLRPRQAAQSLLAWSYGRAGDRPRAGRALTGWPEAPRAVAAALAGPRLEATAAVGGGHDTNVRLDVDSLDEGVASPWLGGSGVLLVRPLPRRDALELRLAVEQRFHLAERSQTSRYDLGRVVVGASGAVGLLDESLRLSAHLLGHEELGDGLGRHLAQGAALELRAGAHPIGPHEVGVYGGVALRDLDGEGLGDPARDDQDAVLVDAGAYADVALVRAAARGTLAIGYHDEVARAGSWDARGVVARGSGTWSPAPFALSLDAGWRWRRFGAASADEHRFSIALETSWTLGLVRPYLRGVLERSLGLEALRTSRVEIAAGVAVTGRLD